MNNPRAVTGAQRVANALQRTNQLNQPTYCKECGSTFFIEASASMYTPASNGLRSISVTPMKIYVCPCGALQLPPGYNAAAPAGSERAFFGDALAAAAASQERHSLDKIAEGCVSLAEYHQLLDGFNDLVGRFNELVAGKTVDPIEMTEAVDETEQEVVETAEPVQTVARPSRGSTVTIEDPNNLGSRLPIASGISGRSVAASAQAANDGTRWVESEGRPPVPGGARARMQRQGA